MDPLQSLLANLETGQPVERDLEFSVDPARIRKILSTLVEADPLLWLKHLVQFCQTFELQQPLTLTFEPHSSLCLTLLPSQAELLKKLSPRRLFSHEKHLLARKSEAFLARILCEVPSEVTYRNSYVSGELLRVGPTEFHLEESAASHKPVPQGISIEISLRPQIPGLKALGPDAHSLRKIVQLIGGLSEPLPVVTGAEPLTPDWPFPPILDEGDEPQPVLWDWESVAPAVRGGFPWTVSAWGEPLESLQSDSDLRVVRHTMEIWRSFSTLPVLGCYPPQLALKLNLGPSPSRARLTVTAERVFGVSWTANAPKRAELFPIIHGVVGVPILLEGVPPGIYLLADASHLKTDASGVALVRDETTQAWIDELIGWAKGQTEIYLPFLRLVPRIWMGRVKRWEDLSRPPSPWKKMWQSAISGLFSIGPLHTLMERRTEELSAWLAQRDSV